MEGCPGLGAQLVHPWTGERAESLQVQVDICGSGNSCKFFLITSTFSVKWEVSSSAESKEKEMILEE